jgi:hypothetical protein
VGKAVEELDAFGAMRAFGLGPGRRVRRTRVQASERNIVMIAPVCQ